MDSRRSSIASLHSAVSLHSLPMTPLEGVTSITVVTIGYKVTGEDGTIVTKTVPLKVTNQHSVGRIIDKIIASRIPKHVNMSKEYCLVIEGKPDSKMIHSTTPLTSNKQCANETLLLMHQSDPDLVNYSIAVPSRSTSITSSIVVQDIDLDVTHIPVRDRKLSSAVPITTPISVALDSKSDVMPLSLPPPTPRKKVLASEIGCQSVPQVADCSQQASTKTEAVGSQTSVGISEVDDSIRKSGLVHIDPAVLAAELRLFRRRQRIADPVARTAERLLADVAILRAEYPEEGNYLHRQLFDPTSSLTESLKDLDDPVLSKLASVVDKERLEMSSVISALQRQAQTLRHGWLTESSKVERLIETNNALLSDRENAFNMLADNGRVDSVYLSRLVHRRLDADVSLMNLETEVLRDRVQWYKTKYNRLQSQDEQSTVPIEDTQPQSSPRLDRDRVDDYYNQRLKQLEEENDILAQRLVLYETKTEILGGSDIELQATDESRILAEKVIDLEGELLREKDLRMQYAVRGEVIKNIGISEIIRQKEHITLQQQVMASAGVNPGANSPLRRYADSYVG